MICRENGYNSGFASCCNAFGYHYRDSQLTGFNCTGNETRLLDCPHSMVEPADKKSEKCKYASAVCVNQINNENSKFLMNEIFLRSYYILLPPAHTKL